MSSICPYLMPHIAVSAQKAKHLVCTIDGKATSSSCVVKKWKLFRQRLEYHIGLTMPGWRFEYIAYLGTNIHTSPDQRRLHIHAITINMPYVHTSVLMDIWDYGGIYVRVLFSIGPLLNYIENNHTQATRCRWMRPRGR